MASKRRIILNWIILIVLVSIGVLTLPAIMPKFKKPETPYVLFYYYQNGCPACDEMEPVVEDLKEKYVDCVTVRRRNLQWMRGHGVTATPTVVLENEDGVEMQRWIGVQPVRVFIQQLAPLCVKGE